MSARPSSKSLRLRWVVVAIVVFAGGYTFLRLHYGKHGRSFEPYRDLGERATTRRLVGLGYQRLAVEIDLLPEPLPAASLAPHPAEISGAAGGLPADLAGALAIKPELPVTIGSLTAPRDIAAGGSYALQFNCAQADYRTQVESVLLLRKDHELFLLPNSEKVPGKLQARWKEALVVARFSTTGLPAGRYTATLCAGHGSKQWEFTVH